MPEGLTEAFEVYFALGVNRSLEETERTTGLALETLQEWAEVYQWDQHVQARLVELNQSFAEHFHTQTQNVRTEMLQIITQTLDQFREDSAGVPFPITSLDDLEKLARAYERLNRANAIALEAARQIDPSGGDQPQTWADLLRTVNPGEQGGRRQ